MIGTMPTEIKVNPPTPRESLGKVCEEVAETIQAGKPIPNHVLMGLAKLALECLGGRVSR